MTDEMRYPEDETELSAAQMGSIMAEAEETELVSLPPMSQSLDFVDWNQMVPLATSPVGSVAPAPAIVDAPPALANR